MSLAAALLLSAASASVPTSSSAVGILRLARGPVLSNGASVGSGHLIRADEELRVGSGWAELLIGHHLRARISAGARVRVATRTQLELQGGRAWLELGAQAAPLTIRLQHQALELAPGSVAVIDGSAKLVAVAAGRVRVDGLVVEAGWSWSQASPDRREPGDGGLLVLVRREARHAAGDLAGWRALVLAAAAVAEAEEAPPSTELGARIGEPSSLDLLLEEALRPAPFSSDETSPSAPEP